MPNGAKVVGAAAGRYVSMALDEQGRLYTWGHDGCANGGKLPAREEAYKPRLVEGALAGGCGGRGWWCPDRVRLSPARYGAAWGWS